MKIVYLKPFKRLLSAAFIKNAITFGINCLCYCIGQNKTLTPWYCKQPAKPWQSKKLSELIQKNPVNQLCVIARSGMTKQSRKTMESTLHAIASDQLEHGNLGNHQNQFKDTGLPQSLFSFAMTTETNQSSKNNGLPHSYSKLAMAGFSLVEMLMALLVASLLLAALAPVMTRRFTGENLNISGIGGGSKAPAGFKCWSWEAKDLNENNQRVITDYKFDDVWYLNFIIASGGAGGAGATVSSEESDTIDSNNPTLTTTGLKITKDMGDFEITSLIGGGAGAGGGAAVFSGSTCSGSPSIAKCECMGASYDPKSKVCVSRNLGNNTRTNAISACSNNAPSGKWSLPNTTQLSNWNIDGFYNTLGITTGATVWSVTTGTGSCASSSNVTRYRCTCNGSSISGYTSSSACCSGCSYGSSQATTKYSCYCNGSKRTGYSSSSSCCSGCSYGTSSTGSTKYSCYCNGSKRTDYASSSSCCSGCKYGKRDGYAAGYCNFTCNDGSQPPCGTGNKNCAEALAYNYRAYGERQCSSHGGLKSVTNIRCVAGAEGEADTCASTVTSTPGSTTTTACTSTAYSYSSGGNTCSSTATSYSTSVCNSYNTNYYYYQLSGSSWTSSYSTSATGSRTTYCVYNDSSDVVGESFYSLSGGGGGGAPAIQNNNFNSNIKTILNQKIKENVDGYIVLEKGEGGKGGDASSNKNQKAQNGEDGKPSCIAILDSSRKLQYRVCVKGGKKGYGADATKTDSSSTGWGAAGIETPSSDSCFAIDYSTDTNGVQTTFSCSDKGKAGTAGGASTNNPTPGGTGGASILNNVTVSNNGKDGLTPSSLNYGAGGGGGSATKTGVGSSASLSFGKGGDGADGYIKLSFKHKYDGAGGGGGSAGTVAIVNNILIGKSATCTVKIGAGGSGGGINADGIDGGNSSVQCSNESTIYEVYGGKKGSKGISAANAGQISQGGKGGTFNDGLQYSESIAKLVAKNDAKIYKGLAGTDGGFNNTSYTNYIQGEKSAGGRGGTSGPGKKGKCGAILNDVVCSTNIGGFPLLSALNAEGFTYKDIVEPTAKSIVLPTPTYGESSSGGGGGAWYQGVGSGSGGDGLGGYVCIYWQAGE